MLHTIRVDAEKVPKIQIFPQTQEVEILQNVWAILSTLRGSVPLDRELGIDFSILDQNLAIAENLYLVEIVDALEKYEPRVQVENIKLEYKDESISALVPSIGVSIVG